MEDGDELYWEELRAWNPEAPEGEWRPAWKGDTEDGPYAWFVRPMALRPEPATPPVHRIDLGSVREFLRRRMAQWRTHLPSDPGALGTVAISGDGEGGYNNDVRIYREGIALMDQVLALIDNPRDAAPGVPHGR